MLHMLRRRFALGHMAFANVSGVSSSPDWFAVSLNRILTMCAFGLVAVVAAVAAAAAAVSFERSRADDVRWW